MSVMLISGDEPLLVDRAVSAAVSRLSAHDPDIERRESTASELTVGSYSDLVAPSLFAEPRVVVIRQAHEAAKELAAALIDYLGDPVDGVTLVVQHGGGARNKALAEACLAAGAKPVQCSRITTTRGSANRLGATRSEKEPTVSSLAVDSRRSMSGSCADRLLTAADTARSTRSGSSPEISTTDTASSCQWPPTAP